MYYVRVILCKVNVNTYLIVTAYKDLLSLGFHLLQQLRPSFVLPSALNGEERCDEDGVHHAGNT